jgi:hypothetical protein
MKNRTLLIGLVVIVCAALLGCDMPVLNNNLREPFVTQIPGEVRSLSVVPGAKQATLSWIEPTDTDFDHTEISFSAGNKPIEVLPLLPKGVHEFTIEYLDYGLTYAITVKLVDTNGNKSLGSLVIVTVPRVVDDLNLAPYITAPVQDLLPDTRPITGTQYTGTVSWSYKIGSDTYAVTGSGGKFVVDRTYLAKVTLKPNPGYTFAGLENDSFTYGGAAVVTNAVSGVMEITFPALDKAWFVASYGNDTLNNGLTSDTALKTVNRALELIKDAGPLTSATIVVIGTSGDKKTIVINNTTNIYPPITLRGLSPTQPGILTADKDGWTNPSATNAYRVMTITGGATVTLGNDLTITGGGQRAYVSVGAGVVVYNNGIANPFTMNGGTITGNKAYQNAEGKGGGVYVYDTSAFIMNGGVISDNYAFHTGGVAIDLNSTFTMTGGTITDNECEHGGGGVRANYASTFTMSGGVISANKVNDGFGGGIYSFQGSIIMSGGTVTGNTALMACGGIDIDSDTATFIMTGGTIADNTAPQGGGVGVIGNASFTMRGGIIKGNTASAGGGGVAVLGGTFKKEPANEGEASGIIYGNNGGADSNRAATSADTLLMNLGHAVYIAPEAGGPESRETTVTAYESLDSTVPGADGGWVVQ